MPNNNSQRPPKRKPINPIEAAIRAWFQVLPTELLDSISLSQNTLILNGPKRWTVYPPMCLLPSGSFEFEWEAMNQQLTAEQRSALWQLILQEVGKREGKGALTHLAINSGIPLKKSGGGDQAEEENILRTPSGLMMLQGDFGPALTPDALPTSEDFDRAFWVSTKQNGITQTWAPRYTMFSRGNIKEKARLLDFHKAGKLETRAVDREELRDSSAVDFYAGIGYFVFSYVVMGIGRVIGWELNPWSVEGLRRGAVANGWTVRIVKIGHDWETADERIIIFQEDNQHSQERLRSSIGKNLLDKKVLHVNCGLLPSSLPVWRFALDLLDNRGWIHLHENVGVNDISQRTLQIARTFQKWEAPLDVNRPIQIDHVELVKTFAPGVWHCVFDLFIGGRRIKPILSERV